MSFTPAAYSFAVYLLFIREILVDLGQIPRNVMTVAVGTVGRGNEEQAVEDEDRNGKYYRSYYVF